MASPDLSALQYLPEEILEKREAVRRTLLQRSSRITDGCISIIHQSDLALLFELYDQIFFHRYFRDHFRGKISFSLSSQMTKSAGKLLYRKDLPALSPGEERYELRISALLLFSYGSLERDKVVNGITTRDSLEALQLVFEHELIHLIELRRFKKSSCSQARFQTLAFNIFGHTGSTHQLPAIAEIGRERYGLAVGDWVSFQFEGERLSGVINRITKRATVMVPHKSGDFQDQEGKRYRKYYIALSLLEKSSRRR
ncbi:MAG: SprT family zinc-dependent metalloprotease [Firmicutes bacterium]|nr:SprT family zinc-dependent metalloprotease [Bacillota bacterium]